MSAAYLLWALGIGAVLAFIAATVQSMPYRDGTITDGTVVTVDSRTSRFAGSGRRTSRTYAPVVQFTDAAGTSHTVSPSISGGEPPEVGSTVKVSYQSSRPGKARVLNGGRTGIGRYLFLIVGIGFIVASIFVR